METRVHHMQTVVFNRFAAEALPSIKASYEKDGEVDIPARREGWSNFIDNLNNGCVLFKFNICIGMSLHGASLSESAESTRDSTNQ